MMPQINEPADARRAKDTQDDYDAPAQGTDSQRQVSRLYAPHVKANLGRRMGERTMRFVESPKMSYKQFMEHCKIPIVRQKSILIFSNQITGSLCHDFNGAQLYGTFEDLCLADTYLNAHELRMQDTKNLIWATKHHDAKGVCAGCLPNHWAILKHLETHLDFQYTKTLTHFYLNFVKSKMTRPMLNHITFEWCKENLPIKKWAVRAVNYHETIHKQVKQAWAEYYKNNTKHQINLRANPQSASYDKKELDFLKMKAREGDVKARMQLWQITKHILGKESERSTQVESNELIAKAFNKIEEDEKAILVYSTVKPIKVGETKERKTIKIALPAEDCYDHCCQHMADNVYIKSNATGGQVVEMTKNQATNSFEITLLPTEDVTTIEYLVLSAGIGGHKRDYFTSIWHLILGNAKIKHWWYNHHLYAPWQIGHFSHDDSFRFKDDAWRNDGPGPTRLDTPVETIEHFVQMGMAGLALRLDKKGKYLEDAPVTPKSIHALTEINSITGLSTSKLEMDFEALLNQRFYKPEHPTMWRRQFLAFVEQCVAAMHHAGCSQLIYNAISNNHPPWSCHHTNKLLVCYLCCNSMMSAKLNRTNYWYNIVAASIRKICITNHITSYVMHNGIYHEIGHYSSGSNKVPIDQLIMTVAKNEFVVPYEIHNNYYIDKTHITWRYVNNHITNNKHNLHNVKMGYFTLPYIKTQDNSLSGETLADLMSGVPPPTRFQHTGIFDVEHDIDLMEPITAKNSIYCYADTSLPLDPTQYELTEPKIPKSGDLCRIDCLHGYTIANYIIHDDTIAVPKLCCDHRQITYSRTSYVSRAMELYSMALIPPRYQGPVEYLLGVGGAGKTYKMLTQAKGKVKVIVPSTKLMDTIKEYAELNKEITTLELSTYESELIHHGKFTDGDELLMDEVTLINPTLIEIVLAKLAPNYKKVVLAGDTSQIQWRFRLGTGKNKVLNRLTDKEVAMKQTRRFGEGTASCLRLMGYEVYGNPELTSNIYISNNKEGLSAHPEAIVMAFDHVTIASNTNLIHPKCKTGVIEQFQGTSSNLTFIICDDLSLSDLAAWEYWVVALTRSRGDTIIIAPPSKYVETVNELMHTINWAVHYESSAIKLTPGMPSTYMFTKPTTIDAVLADIYQTNIETIETWVRNIISVATNPAGFIAKKTLGMVAEDHWKRICNVIQFVSMTTRLDSPDYQSMHVPTGFNLTRDLDVLMKPRDFLASQSWHSKWHELTPGISLLQSIQTTTAPSFTQKDHEVVNLLRASGAIMTSTAEILNIKTISLKHSGLTLTDLVVNLERFEPGHDQDQSTQYFPSDNIYMTRSSLNYMLSTGDVNSRLMAFLDPTGLSSAMLGQITSDTAADTLKQAMIAGSSNLALRDSVMTALPVCLDNKAFRALALEVTNYNRLEELGRQSKQLDIAFGAFASFTKTIRRIKNLYDATDADYNRNQIAVQHATLLGEPILINATIEPLFRTAVKNRDALRIKDKGIIISQPALAWHELPPTKVNITHEVTVSLLEKEPLTSYTMTFTLACENHEHCTNHAKAVHDSFRNSLDIAVLSEQFNYRHYEWPIRHSGPLFFVIFGYNHLHKYDTRLVYGTTTYENTQKFLKEFGPIGTSCGRGLFVSRKVEPKSVAVNQALIAYYRHKMKAASDRVHHNMLMDDGVAYDNPREISPIRAALQVSGIIDGYQNAPNTYKLSRNWSLRDIINNRIRGAEVPHLDIITSWPSLQTYTISLHFTTSGDHPSEINPRAQAITCQADKTCEKAFYVEGHATENGIVIHGNRLFWKGLEYTDEGRWKKHLFNNVNHFLTFDGQVPHNKSTRFVYVKGTAKAILDLNIPASFVEAADVKIYEEDDNCTVGLTSYMNTIIAEREQELVKRLTENPVND